MYTKARKLRPGLLDCNTQANIEENLMRMQDDYGYEDEDGFHAGRPEYSIGRKLTESDKGKVLGIGDDLTIKPMTAPGGGGDPGGGNINAWIGTVAEYNALSNEEKNAQGVIHFIKEG